MINPGFILLLFLYFILLKIFPKIVKSTLLPAGVLMAVYFSPAIAVILLSMTALTALFFYKFSRAQFFAVLIAIFILCQTLSRLENISLVLIGLSFGLFRIYSIYQYRKNKTLNAVQTLNYIFFIPSYIAGPISSYEDFNNSENKKENSFSNITILFLTGLFKLAIASFLQPEFVKFLDLAKLTDATFLLSVGIKYAILYYNFSGYTDIARALAISVGIDLPENFKNPFAALSFSEFWNRQHMSLTNWLKENVYLPLTFFMKNHKSFKFVPGFVVLLLVSFWHGVNTGVLIFFIIHVIGIYLVDTNRFIEKIKSLRLRHAVIQTMIAFSVFFLIGTADERSLLTDNLFKLNFLEIFYGLTIIYLVVAINEILLNLGDKILAYIYNHKIKYFMAGAGMAVFLLSILYFPNADIDFIYSKF